MYTNNNKKIFDTPVWLPTAQLRTATSALAAMTSAKSGASRYVYYMSGSLFYRYDTWKDMHQKLASPNIAAVTAASLRYDADGGYRGNVLAGVSGGLTIAGLNSNVLNGLEIEITSGKGIGQIRTINGVSPVTIRDTGTVTAASATLLTDTTRRWKINQWIGYQVRVVYGTGASQVRKVLYNDATTLYFQDANYQQLEPWNNTVFSATAPYAVPVATAGLQAIYYIESSDITVNTAWDLTPDTTSSYVIKGGGVFMLSATAAAPFSSFQYYNVLSDTWTTKTPLGGNLLAALGTDFDMTLISKETLLDSGTASAGSARTLTDGTKTLTVDRYTNYEIRITGGTGIGQRRRIVGNTATMYEVAKPWDTAPDATSTYSIYPDTNKIYLFGNGASSAYQYSIEEDAWHTSHSIDYGITRNMTVSFAGQEPFAITSAVRNTGGITALNATPTAGGTGYAAGDLFNITTGGTVGKGRVVSVSAGGVVTAVELYSAGLNYTTGTGKATTAISGVGTGLTVEITSIGTVGRITTATNLNLAVGDSITLAGIVEAAWNTTYTILAIDALNTFDIVITATATAVASNSQSTTVIVDASKNWAVNEHAGKIIKLDVAGTAPTTQLRRITSNTATTITVATIVAGVNGTSRYVIMQPEAIGNDRQYKAPNEGPTGRATGGSTTTLIDSTKAWATNQWANYRIRIVAGTGVGSEFAITSNTATTLTYSTQSFTPDATTKYRIMDTFGTMTAASTTTITDTSKNWIVNQWAGKRVVITAGTGQRQEATIASNTATVLTLSVAITLPDTTSTYSILAIAPRSVGISARWIFGNSDPATKANMIIIPRGGATNTIDEYQINTDWWDFTIFYSPQSETLTTGSSYAYDGVDTFYFTTCVAADFIYIFALNLNTGEVDGAFQTTATQGTVHIGGFMEIVSSEDGGKFLFIALCTSRIMYKALIY